VSGRLRIPWDAALVGRLAGVHDVERNSVLGVHYLNWRWSANGPKWLAQSSKRPWTVRSAFYRITGYTLTEADVEHDQEATT
jgi:hypothetical protein